MEATIDEETKLMKELELLTACATLDDSDVLLPFLTNEKEVNLSIHHDKYEAAVALQPHPTFVEKKVNLSIPDPKSQHDIDRMDPKDAKRFNDATITEVNGMKGKRVFINATMDELPLGTKDWCKLVKIPSKQNTADMMTKILPASTVSVFSRILLGLPDILNKGMDSDCSAMLT